MIPRIEIMGVPGIPEVTPGADLGRLIAEACARDGLPLADGDLVVVTQKVVSKAEGRVVPLMEVRPSQAAVTLAQELGKHPHLTELVLREAAQIVKTGPGVLICETRHGFVCANAGVDRSNVGGGGLAVLLPEDPDASAERIRERLRDRTGARVGVLISDTFMRPWREGGVNVAIGLAGAQPLLDYQGKVDPDGYVLTGASLLAVADELASAAELVMGKLARVPVAVIRGYPVGSPGNARALLRERRKDLFR